MTENTTPDSPELREALEDLQSYLSDNIPPLFFSESIEVLFEAPPALVAAQVIGWTTGQHGGGSMTTADLLFHAAKKIHMLCELELVPDTVIKEFLIRLRPELLAGCPAADQPSLAADLDRLDLEVTLASPGTLDVVYRRAGDRSSTGPVASRDGGGGVPADVDLDQMSHSVGEGLKRLDHMLSRLGSQPVQPAGQPAGRPPVSGELTAQVLTQGTVDAENAEELNGFLAELKKRGVSAKPEDLMKMLAQSLPDWAAPPVTGGSPAEAPQSAVRAMHKYISLAKGQEESRQRFSELVDTAVEEFNGDSLGRAVTLLDLAESMMTKKEVDNLFAQSVQRQARIKLDDEQLRKALDDEERHHLLRRFLKFLPEFSPEQLLIELEEEPNRERRRFLLALLAAQGEDTRQAVLKDLAETVSGAASFPWYYHRNLVYLLRTIPRDEETPTGPEIDLLVWMSELDREFPLVRESVGALGQYPEERAITALSGRLAEIEDALLGKREVAQESEHLLLLLDAIVRALIRIDLPEARRAAVAHGLKRDAELGRTHERVSWMSSLNLAGNKPLVGRIIAEIRARTPQKVFGMTIKTSKKSESIGGLIRALSATDTPEVREMLQEIVESYSGQPFASLAAKTLHSLAKSAEAATAAAAAPKIKPSVVKASTLQPADLEADEATPEETEPAAAASTLSGDLALFGLPNLLQNLSDSQVGGLLQVFGSSGAVAAEIWLRDGMILGARAGKRHGEVAVYDLLQDPSPGRFELGAPTDPPPEIRTSSPLPIQAVLFEGIRRYDEFKRAAAMVPDEARYRPAGVQPTLPEGETDAELFKEVWRRAAASLSPAESEDEIPVDRFRVRCFFEHWVAEGSLAPANDLETEEKRPGEEPPA